MITLSMVQLTSFDVEFTLEIEPEDTPVRGNALASGDEAGDKACEDEIVSRLDSGDQWAWCCVKVTASWGPFSYSDYLGCCSYADEAEFECSMGSDMRAAALEGLNAKIAKTYASLASLIQVQS